jgi:TM2 domain-containing membrane protein YozV
MNEKEKKPETIYITEEELGPPLAPGMTSMGMPATPTIRLCPGCQRQINLDTVYCQFCGYGPLKATTSYEVKKKGTAALLAVVPALFGFFGIAHFYLERIGTGFLIMFAGWALAAAAVLSWVLLGEWLWAVVLGCLYIGVFIWQVFDAVSIAEEHYRALETV